LKETGLSLQEIGVYLDGKMNVQTKIKELEEKKALIDTAIQDLKIRTTVLQEAKISEIMLPERLCLCHAFRAKNGEQALAEISGFYNEIVMSGITMDKRWWEFCEYPNDELINGNFETTDFLITICIPIEEKDASPHAVRYPAIHGVVCNFRGGYYELWQAYAAIHEYLSDHHYQIAGHAQEEYLEIDAGGAIDITDEHNITRVIVPVKKREPFPD
jgi:effector-binding domain-containing protein